MSDDHHTFSEQFAQDLLHGADEIRDYLNSLGFKINSDGVYYAHREQKWPITKHGKFLISTKSQLSRHARKITAVKSSPAA
jgi:hypothetical protein